MRVEGARRPTIGRGAGIKINKIANLSFRIGSRARGGSIPNIINPTSGETECIYEAIVTALTDFHTGQIET